MTNVNIDGKEYCAETLLFEVKQLKQEVIAGVELHNRILNDIKEEIKKESEVNILQLHWGEAMGLNKAIDIIDKYLKEE